jgi:cysteinyl-tRNA synthetase
MGPAPERGAERIGPAGGRRGLTALVGGLALVGVCLATREGAGATPASARPWADVHNWVYWLDRPALDQIAGSEFELAVIDYSADGSADGELTAAQVEGLRAGHCPRRVLAYLSVGQAEDYRYYWQPGWRPGAPDWLGAEDPDWPGNYFVAYWSPAWQQLVLRYLDRIVDQGFDGVYLDRVDAYAEPYAQGHEQDMVDFVGAIGQYARARSPLGDDFGVVVQNAEQLAAGHPEYVAGLTGVAREEVYVAATDRPTTGGERGVTEAALDLIRQGSRAHLVLTVDYARSPALVDDAYRSSRAKGYRPYVTDVDLDRLRVDPGFEPSCAPLVASSAAARKRLPSVPRRA